MVATFSNEVKMKPETAARYTVYTMLLVALVVGLNAVLFTTAYTVEKIRTMRAQGEVQRAHAEASKNMILSQSLGGHANYLKYLEVTK